MANELTVDEAVRSIIRSDFPNPILNNRAFHQMVTDGVDVTFFRNDREVTDKVRLLIFHGVECGSLHSKGRVSG